VVLKREEILKSLWGDDDYFMGRSLDVFISRLRKILANEKGITIENLHGIGFRFSVE
jgi:DNA-binding response OmpR family regulator